jgi:outer membrane lipopolysaccharide assembly protein LptE/RlpB
MLRDLGAYGFFPCLDRERLFEARFQGWIFRANLREDVLDGVECHRVRPEYMNGGLLSIRRALNYSVLIGLAALSAGCGYALQNSKTNSLKEVGVERVYVAPVKNQSYKTGVENIVYNELVQAIITGGRVKVVDRPEFADAILDSTITKASYAPSALAQAPSIYPTSIAAIQITVATEYQADVSCSFTLRRQKGGSKGAVIWGADFARSKRFAGNNQKAEYGVTSGLINESEFDRTLREVSHGMMRDVHESMVARF